jgi:copper chaperone CopZ
MNIDFDLEDLAGVVSCKTSYAAQTTEVTYDADVIDVEAIIVRIGTIGYSAVVQS